MFFTIDVLKNFVIFTGNHLCWSLFIEKETPKQVFSCEYCELFKNRFFIEHLWCLLLIFSTKCLYLNFYIHCCSYFGKERPFHYLNRQQVTHCQSTYSLIQYCTYFNEKQSLRRFLREQVKSINSICEGVHCLKQLPIKHWG